jgi:aminoglycoside/choline kinase family phosphotransferase
LSDREDNIVQFLADNDWADAQRTKIAGDASNRRYERLKLGGRFAILMDAPPDTSEPIVRFIEVAKYLCRNGLNAPEIFAQDEKLGLILLEDFGDQVFARLIAKDLTKELPLYVAATDVLLQLATLPPMQGLKLLDPSAAAGICDVTFDWYGVGVNAAEKTAALTAIEIALVEHAPLANVTALRDYHVENLIWRPSESGARRIGLLDFQDAVVAHPAYDLVSLLTDVRRNVPTKTKNTIIDHYLAHTTETYTDFTATFSALSAQRALRILGVFARLSLARNKPQYVNLIPRVWGELQNALAHPALRELRSIIDRTLPEPDATTLERLSV